MALRTRCILIVLLLVAAVAVGADIAAATPGDLDPSFATGGTLTFRPQGVDSLVNDVAIQPDGKIVLAGYASGDFAVARLNPDGTPDPTFGNGGSVVENAVGTNSEDIADAVAIQPDGKIVVAGASTTPNAISSFATFLRLKPDGTPDASFDPGGMTPPVPENVGIARASMGEAYDLAIDPAGRIVYAGTNSFAGVSFVDRLKTDGTHDDSWGSGAADVFDTASPEFLARLALQADGKVVVAGSIGQGTGSDVAVARVLADGSGLDSGFGNGGRLTFGYGAGNEDAAADVVVQPDGRIVVGGFGGAAADFTVTRLTTGGIIDSTFAGGSVLADFGGDNTGQAIALQADGKIVLGGSASGTAFGVARFHPGGALDSTFGKGGKATVAFPTASNATSMAIQPDGRIVIAGSNALGQMVVARLQGDPPGSGNPGGAPGGGGRVPRCAGHAATIVGTSGRDRLVGTRKADVIVALGGSDRISGGGGNDIICGGSGNDAISGGNGNDKLYGEDGKDSLSGGAGKDKESGGVGNDKLSGGSGNDTLTGGAGNDKLSGGAGKDKDSGGGGKDSCSGGDTKKSC
jgi:uncharacterized delta-60 repeat protein